MIPQDVEVHRIPATGEEFYSFEDFRATGLLIATNAMIAPFGFQCSFVYPTYDFVEPVGWWLHGTGRGPMFPLNEDENLKQSIDNLRNLLTPRIRNE